jgi:hypothetical protein
MVELEYTRHQAKKRGGIHYVGYIDISSKKKGNITNKYNTPMSHLARTMKPTSA